MSSKDKFINNGKKLVIDLIDKSYLEEKIL